MSASPTAMAPVTMAPVDAPHRHSRIYRGIVQHRRHQPKPYRFRLRLYLLYLDLDEVDTVFAGRWLWSATRVAPMRFWRPDYLGPADVPLKQAVLDEYARATGHRPGGAVRMLTNLRCLGYCFNPVTFYYCFESDGRLAGVLAQITNTPWGERHCYVVAAGDGGGPLLRARFDKAFHVSPFLPMGLRYDWRFSPPGDTLLVHMEDHDGDAIVFDASLAMHAAPITGANLARVLLRHPWMTGTVILLIYWHALWLWLRRVPFHPHPSKQSPA